MEYQSCSAWVGLTPDLDFRRQVIRISCEDARGGRSVYPQPANPASLAWRESCPHLALAMTGPNNASGGRIW